MPRQFHHSVSIPACCGILGENGSCLFQQIFESTNQIQRVVIARELLR